MLSGTGQAALETTTDQDRTSRRRPDGFDLLFSARQHAGGPVCTATSWVLALANSINSSAALLSAARSNQTGPVLCDHASRMPSNCQGMSAMRLRLLLVGVCLKVQRNQEAEKCNYAMKISTAVHL